MSVILKMDDCKIQKYILCVFISIPYYKNASTVLFLFHVCWICNMELNCGMKVVAGIDWQTGG